MSDTRMRGYPLNLLGSLSLVLMGGCQDTPAPTLTIYSGRSEALVQPLITRFEEQTGIVAEVRYGGSAQLAATILEEDEQLGVDVYFGQDAGALGSLSHAGRLSKLPEDVLSRVEPRFRSRDGRWVGTSGRARVLAYDSATLSEEDLPRSVKGLTDPSWRGRVGWAPANGSFQAFVTAMRLIDGEQATADWLQAMIANDTKSYRDNTPLLEAVLSGDLDVALTNHYYLYRFLAASTLDVPAKNYSPEAGGPGALVNVAGVGIVENAANPDAAYAFVDYLLSLPAQSYFASEVFEYPLVAGIGTEPSILPLSEIHTPDIDLSDLHDLQGTLALLESVGVL